MAKPLGRGVSSILLLCACGESGQPAASSTSSTGEAVDSTSTSSESSTSSTDTSTGAIVPPDVGVDIPDDGDDPPDGDPLPDATVGTWQWIEIEGASCRDGSQAGFAYKVGSTDALMIYFASGGACFNGGTCFTNPAFIDPQLPTQGLFANRSDNPVADWHQVFVPYCTGDVHAGMRPDGGESIGTAGQRFVGWTNVGLYLARLHPSFPDATQVLVTGSSAGGFGAGANLERIAARWPDAQITMIDDAGTPMADDWLAPCLQQRWRETWGIDETFLAACGSPCLDDPNGGGIIEMIAHFQTTLPDVNIAFISSTEDATMRQFYAYGYDDCAMIDVLMPPLFPAAEYTAGLVDLRERLDGPRSGSFFFPGEQHIVLDSDWLYYLEANGTAMNDWVAATIAGDAAHLGPGP